MAHYPRSLKGIEAAHRKCHLTGLTSRGFPLWTEEENAVLRACWPNYVGQPRLSHRTAAAIRSQASKLGLPRCKRNHIWTTPQVAKFERMWPVATRAELLEAFPWAEWADLMNKAQDLRRRGRPNLRRPKQRPFSTGNAVLDSVLSRAYSANLTMAELDARVGSGTYFYGGRFRRRLDWDRISRAAEVLGGELLADWSAVARSSCD